MKNFVLLLFFVPFCAGAQITHTVQAKETLYSLGRKFNVHPKELAAYNNIPVETGLSVGQIIKIPQNRTMAPLPPANPSQKETVVKEEKPVVKKELAPAPKKEEAVKNITAKKEEVAHPVYHKVEKKETLYHISKMYNNVSVEDIKKWNKLTGDGVSEGTKLIVGYANTGKGEKAQESVIREKKPSVAEKPVPAEEVSIKVKPLDQEKKEPEKIIKAAPENNSINEKDLKGGVFRAMYEQQNVSGKNGSAETGTAGTFKSTSGWEDGKYYCLSNSVPTGTIVKVTYPATQRSVYAKVLDQIPDLKQNAGILIRLSNAAASELGVNSDHFECLVNY